MAMHQNDLSEVDESTLEQRMNQVERCVEALKSGMSMDAFCKQEHVAPRTMRSWAKKLDVELPQQRSNESASWVELEVPEEPIEMEASYLLEVEVAHMVVKLPLGCTKEKAAWVLELLATLS